MLLLCLDTATPQVGVAIGSDDQIIGRVQLARPQHHAEHLAPAIAYLLEQLDLSLDQLSAIGVGIGPGLFTGLRVGVTTAKVMAQSLRIPLIAVPSLDPGGVQRLTEYEVGTPADLCAELMSRSEEVLLLGDGAIRYRDDFFNLERVEFGPAALSYPSVSALVELTRARFQREEFSQPRDVHPLYLRLSDAEMNWVKQAR
jgi:tRNA threonylcarbamoyladenosine biosynthesis protein TsaB